jgi:ABC-type lipoprotein export system ATPase subunit
MSIRVQGIICPQCTVLENVLVPFWPGAATEDDPNGQPICVAWGWPNGSRIGRPSYLRRRQRVAIAGHWSRQTLLLADEPTGNLDRQQPDRSPICCWSFKGAENDPVVVTHTGTLAACWRRMGRRGDCAVA